MKCLSGSGGNMSKLSDIVKRKKKSVDAMPVKQEEHINLSKYTPMWAIKTAKNFGFELTDDTGKIDKILAALEKRKGQCPCGGNGAQFTCPCERMRRDGICKCGLYKNIPQRRVAGVTEAKIKERDE